MARIESPRPVVVLIGGREPSVFIACAHRSNVSGGAGCGTHGRVCRPVLQGLRVLDLRSFAGMNEVAVGALLEALSLSRSRRFCLMVEDECANLVRRHQLSRGLVRRLEFPPLSESLRDLISATAARFGLRIRTLPEGDQEKAVELICSAACRAPALAYRDLIPSKCPLESLSRDERQRIKLLDENSRSAGAGGGGGQGPAALVGAGGAENSQAPESTRAGRRVSGEDGGGRAADTAEIAISTENDGRAEVDRPGGDSNGQAAGAGSSDEVGKPCKRARRPAVAVYRPRGAREERELRLAPTACGQKDPQAFGPLCENRTSQRAPGHEGEGMDVELAPQSVGSLGRPVALSQSSERETAGALGVEQNLVTCETSDDCRVLYKYESFQIDPTPRFAFQKSPAEWIKRPSAEVIKRR
jgi:hypothetical protein